MIIEDNTQRPEAFPGSLIPTGQVFTADAVGTGGRGTYLRTHSRIVNLENPALDWDTSVMVRGYVPRSVVLL